MEEKIVMAQQSHFVWTAFNLNNKSKFSPFYAIYHYITPRRRKFPKVRGEEVGIVTQAEN